MCFACVCARVYVRAHVREFERAYAAILVAHTPIRGEVDKV